MAQILDGKAVSAKIREELRNQLLNVKGASFPHFNYSMPCLAVVLCTDDPASKVYVRHKQKACEEVGITSYLLKPFDGGIEKYSHPKEHLLATIRYLNNDPAVHGVLVQLPLPPEIDCHEVFDTIDPRKDVDVFNPANVGLLMQGRPRFIPCTPHGVQELLFHSGIEIAGKKVAIINRSDIVGKPLSALLIQDEGKANATVVTCHDRTPSSSLKQVCLAADIIVVAVGKPDFLKPEMVPEGAIVVDVGINRVGERLVGDCHPDVAEKCSWISPVPGGVGPMTVTMLLKNTIKAHHHLVYNQKSAS